VRTRRGGLRTEDGKGQGNGASRDMRMGDHWLVSFRGPTGDARDGRGLQQCPAVVRARARQSRMTFFPPALLCPHHLQAQDSQVATHYHRPTHMGGWDLDARGTSVEHYDWRTSHQISSSPSPGSCRVFIVAMVVQRSSEMTKTAL
jgi:hypothetical protein